MRAWPMRSLRSFVETVLDFYRISELDCSQQHFSTTLLVFLETADGTLYGSLFVEHHQWKVTARF